MIVGSGMLATIFESYGKDSDVIIFASGVSNSKEVKDRNFQREKDLLSQSMKDYSGKTFVYFSTCSIEDASQKNSSYVKHKIDMEKLIQNTCGKYYIFRLPQVVGESRSPTLVNFLVNAIQNGEEFEIQKNATRNLIDVTDVFRIADQIIKEDLYSNEITNIATPYNSSVLEIVDIIENILNKKANFNLIEYGEKQSISIDKMESLGPLYFGEHYLKDILTRRITRGFY